MSDTVSLLPGLRSPGVEEDRRLFRSFAELGDLMSRLRQQEKGDDSFPALHGPWKNHNGCTRSGGSMEPMFFASGASKLR